VSDVTIVYDGPSGAYHCADADGTWHELIRGVQVKVTEDFAAELLEVEGHEFTLPDDVEITTEQDGETDEEFTAEQDPNDPDDPDGVNAAPTYLEE
jgi:hypothetical protein